MSETLTLREVRVPGGGAPSDIVIADGTIAQIVPAGESNTNGEVVEAGGRWVTPGLWDAHTHFTQHVIRRRRVDLTETRSAAEAIELVRQARASGWPLVSGVLMGYGFRDGLWTEPASLEALDAAVSDVPVVLVSGDLHCGWMNRLAAQRLGAQVDETGMLREGPWIEKLHSFDESGQLPMEAYRDAAQAAASRGLVGIVDYEKTDNVAEWSQRTASGVDALRVDVAVWPDRLEQAIEAGRRTGDIVDGAGLIRFGRLKVVVDGSLNTRTAWCWDPYPGMDPGHPHACGVESVSVDELRRLLERARGAGIEAAVHAIGDRANSEVLDVFADLGMRGVIEHAQLVRADDFSRFAELGLVASVQPEHAMDDRDVADHHWAGRTERAFAFGSLHRAGAALLLGSDAPVAPLDPWISLAAATTRSRGERDAWHPEQRLPFDVALSASVRSAVATGEPADLVLTDIDPSTAERDVLRAMPVAATLQGGRFTWQEL